MNIYNELQNEDVSKIILENLSNNDDNDNGIKLRVLAEYTKIQCK